MSVPAQPTVLVVDDDDDLRAIVEHRLRREGWTVLTAADGQAGLDLARSEHPQVCVLDVMMPRLSGHDVLRALRADDDMRDIKVILLTARSREADLNTGFALGAEDYLTKPFSPSELTARVRSLLTRTAAGR
jgi:DNA-binding response OmpR family regulator